MILWKKATKAIRLFQIFLPFSLLCVEVNAEHSEVHTRILFLTSYHSEFPTVKAHLQGISSLLYEKGREIDMINLDTKRFSNEDRFPVVLEKIQGKVEDQGNYDLVLSSDDNALLFLMEYKEELMGDIPVIFFGINDVDLAQRAAEREDFFGIVEKIPLIENVELAFQLLPNLDILHVLTDASPSGQAHLRNLMSSLSPELRERVEVEDLGQKSFEEGALSIHSYGDQDAILLITALVDVEGTYRDFWDSIIWLNQHANLPIFYPLSHGIGFGILGGATISHFDMAKIAAEYAEDYLSGGVFPASGIIAESDRMYLFDYDEIQRHQVVSRNLPEASVILGRPVSFIEKNKVAFIVAFIIAVLLSVFGVIITVFYLRERKLLRGLEESVGQTESLFRNSYAPILLIDAKNGKILDANPAALRYYDYSKPEITKKKLGDIDSGSFRDFANLVDRVLVGDGMTFQCEHRLHNGDVRKVEVQFTCLQVDQEDVLFSIIQDTTERRKAEEALVRERMRLENILSGTHVGTWEWNVQTGEISVNERWGEILGYRIEEISPLSYEMWQSLCHPDDYKNALKSLEKHLAGEAAYYGSEIRMRNKEGQWVWVLDRGRIGSLDEEGRPVWVYGTSLDVSGLKETEDLLQRNLSLLKSLLDSIPDMIFYKDLEGNYLDCNVEFSKFTNQSLKEIRGKTDYDLFPRQLANEFRENDRIVKESGKPRQNMEWLTYPDGRTYLYSMLKAPFRGPDGDIQGVLGVGRDITQQHQDEGKIRLQALVLEQIQDCVMVMDLQGVVTYVNHAVVQTLGYHQSELLGSLVTNFDESSEDYLNMIEILHIALDKGIWEGEISKTTAKGQRKEFFSRWQVVRNETEEIVALCAVFTEITERKKFEAALIQAKETAEAANEAKNVFLATMSHELRTPLNPIFGFTELLMEEENLSEEQKSWLAVIQSRSKDLLLLIEDILNIARIEAGSFIIEAKPTRIQDIFDDIKSIFEQSCQEKGLTLVMELEDELEMLCLIDPARTRQILLNLVGNAIKFSESGQIYVLANRNLVQEEHLSVGEVHFMVRDNGPGIPLKDHDLVFRDFQQLDSSDSRRFEGAGLGLAICKRLVNLMGGEIWIDEDYQNGAEFHVRFPAPLYGEDMDEELNAGAGLKLDEGWPAGKPEMENRPARVIEEDKEGRSVLLVEDDLNSAKIMIADLERKNYQVTHAEDGQTALDMCRSSRYNVILMDLKMPGMGGFEVSRVLRRRGDNTPIVAVNVRAFGTKDTDDLYNPGVGGDPANPIEQRNLWSIIDEAIKNGRG